MKNSWYIFAVCLIIVATASGQTTPGEFNKPWEDGTRALVLDVYGPNRLDCAALAREPRVAGIIHRATIGFRTDTKYAARKVECMRLGYKWGSYHLGRPGDPIKQADFYLATAQPTDDEVVALDLEGTSANDMNLRNAQLFINRVRERTGRYPLLYITDEVLQAILRDYGDDSVFVKTPLWYARYCQNISCYLPNKVWKSYTLWQFASEINCPSKTTSKRNCSPQRCPLNKCPLPAPIPGTNFDMDVNVYNGTVEELRNRWPFTVQ